MTHNCVYKEILCPMNKQNQQHSRKVKIASAEITTAALSEAETTHVPKEAKDLKTNANTANRAKIIARHVKIIVHHAPITDHHVKITAHRAPITDHHVKTTALQERTDRRVQRMQQTLNQTAQVVIAGAAGAVEHRVRRSMGTYAIL